MSEVYLVVEVNKEQTIILGAFSKAVTAICEAIEYCQDDRKQIFEILGWDTATFDELHIYFDRLYVIRFLIDDAENTREIVWDSNDYKYIYRRNHDQGQN